MWKWQCIKRSRFYRIIFNLRRENVIYVQVTKTMSIYLELFSFLSRNVMFKKYSKFHWCTLRGFNFKEKVYELFNNPFYIVKRYDIAINWRIKIRLYKMVNACISLFMKKNKLYQMKLCFPFIFSSFIWKTSIAYSRNWTKYIIITF